MVKERELKRQGRGLSTAEGRLHNLKAKPGASLAMQSSNIKKHRTQRRMLGNDIFRKESILGKEQRALNANDARLKVKDEQHTYGG